MKIEDGRILRVLFMTGYTESATRSGNFLRPGAHILHKPFSPDVLLWKVREVMDEDR